MKKIAFTLYVVGILITFPLYAVLEFNHGTKKTVENNLPHDVIELVERKPLQDFVKVNAQKDRQSIDKVFPVTYNILRYTSFFFPVGFSL